MIRLSKPWKNWPAGHVFTDMPPNVAGTLVSRGIGEHVEEQMSSKIGKTRELKYATRVMTAKE